MMTRSILKKLAYLIPFAIPWVLWMYGVRPVHAAEIKLGGNWWVVENTMDQQYVIVYATKPIDLGGNIIVDTYPTANIAEDVATMLNLAHQRRMDEREGQE